MLDWIASGGLQQLSAGHATLKVFNICAIVLKISRLKKMLGVRSAGHGSLESLGRDPCSTDRPAQLGNGELQVNKDRKT